MHSFKRDSYRSTAALCALLALSGMPGIGQEPVLADEHLAFPEKYGFRLAYYSVQKADTNITVLSSQGLGTGFSFVEDLGGEDSVAIPRLDGFYRFNDKHRIEFGYFTIEREGRDVLAIELDIGDQTFTVGETVISDIKTELFKVDYAYSFYRSRQVELSVSAGLNFTTYEFEYALADDSSAESTNASGPLPMFGLRLGYAITDRWRLNFISEAFYIKLADEFDGSFQYSEINLQYRFSNNLALGGGVTRYSTDLKAKDDDWKGSLADNHRGLMVYASYSL